MQSYWPTVLSDPNSTEGARNHARWYTDATKIIISRTLSSDPANKVIVISDNIAEQINQIKQQPGKNIWMIGSAQSTWEFMRLGLIDEYRLNINPVVLGSGKALFEGVSGLNMNLVETRHFKCGVAGLRYETVRS
jgi:dihydrofolate reductase